MDIKLYKPDGVTSDLDGLLRDKYGRNKNFDYFFFVFNKAFNFCVNNDNIRFYPIAGFVENKLMAHIALIVDKRLPQGEAFFGFLETPEDASVFNSMWKELIKEAKVQGILVLKGPVNGSIWHQYRCIKKSDNSDYIKVEPFSASYYYDYLFSKKPEIEIDYFSAYRENYEIVLRLISEDFYKKIETAGFSIRVTKQLTQGELYTVASISKTVFQNSWGYTELNEKEFMTLYSSEKLSEHLNTIYLLYKGEEIIGFCSTAKENVDTLILKTICVLPPYQGLGLGNALAYKIHSDAKGEGCKKIIYALIREGNNIKNFPKEEAVIFRNYVAFEFKI